MALRNYDEAGVKAEADSRPPGEEFGWPISASQWAWNPASTTRPRIYGPGIVWYRRHVDGGWQVELMPAVVYG